MDLGVEVLHILRSARRLGDPVEGGLDLLRPLMLSLAGLELADPLSECFDVVRKASVRHVDRSFGSSAVHSLMRDCFPRISNSSTNARSSVEPVMFVRV